MFDEKLRANYKITIEGDIVRVVFLNREQDEVMHERMIELLHEDAKRILDNTPSGSHYFGLVDITPIQKRTGLLSEKTKALYADLLEHPVVVKTAIFGANAFYDAVLNFMAYSMKRGDKVRLCKTETEALEWLRSK